MEAAVVSVAEGVLQMLLGKLGSLLMEKYSLMSGVGKEIQYLKDELESINALLCVLAENEDQEEQNLLVKTWMKQVREIAYDAEDCVDNFVHCVSSGPAEQSGFMGFLRKITVLVRGLKARLDVGAEIQSLKTRAKDVSERRARYKLDATATARTTAALEPSSDFRQSSTQLPALCPDVSPLIGVEGRRDKLLEFIQLNDDKMHRQVVAIVGLGGLGKTTLANAVYRSPKTQGSEFQCRAFVTVSQKANMKKLLQNILKEIVPSQGQAEDPLKGMDQWSEYEMIVKIHDQLKDKRYLVVLDDLWELSVWEKMNLCFPESKKGSRIIITTRERTLANRCCHRHPDQDLVYEMEHLKDADSEKLFFKRVFGKDELPENYKELEEPLRKILDKCKGLPLAIVSIGGLLASNPRKTREEWMNVSIGGLLASNPRKTRAREEWMNVSIGGLLASKPCKTIEEWMNVHERLGSELESNTALKLMKQVLTLSYNDLPYHLKACFLYLSIYPEDHEIQRGALLRKWMAEGFVGAMRKMTVEEVAESYFREFISRSVVFPVKVGVDGKVQSCRIHDIMLEVLVSISIQENFLSILSDSRDAVMFQNKIRRLSIHDCDERAKALTRKSIASVRSLTVFDSSEKQPADLSTLTQLRVLDVEGWRGLNDKILKGICKLFGLKYLSIRKTSIKKLPKQIGNLKDLETLDIRETYVSKLPISIAKIANLKYLFMGSYKHSGHRSVKLLRYSFAVQVPPEVGRMKALRTLMHVDATKYADILKTLRELDSLSKLSIFLRSSEETWKPFFESMDYLCDLRYLAVYQVKRKPLDGFANLNSPPLFLRSLILQGPLGTVPSWFSMLNYLTKASFIESEINPKLMQSLGSLQSLLLLSLYDCSYEDNQNANEDVAEAKAAANENNEDDMADGDRINNGENESANGEDGEGPAAMGSLDREDEEAPAVLAKITLKKECGFQKLKHLIIYNLRNVQIFIFEEGSLPSLERLYIENYLWPDQFVNGIEHLGNLKDINLKYKVTEMADKLPKFPRM